MFIHFAPTSENFCAQRFSSATAARRISGMLLAIGRYQAVCPTTSICALSRASRIALVSTSHEALAGGSNVRSRNSIPTSAIQAISSTIGRSGWFMVPISIAQLLAQDRNCERVQVGRRRDQTRHVNREGRRADLAKQMKRGAALADPTPARARMERNWRVPGRAMRRWTTDLPASLYLLPRA